MKKSHRILASFNGVALIFAGLLAAGASQDVTSAFESNVLVPPDGTLVHVDRRLPQSNIYTVTGDSLWSDEIRTPHDIQELKFSF